MLKLTTVRVIPLALSEAMKSAVFAMSANVDSRRVWVLLASDPGTVPRPFPMPRRKPEGFPDPGGLGNPLWSQTDDANALRCELS
jgi:hypothetical protein